MKVQMQKKRARFHAYAQPHKNVWGREHCVELSRLVLGFARQHNRLPDMGDRGFWQLCHDLLKGVFTHKQVQAKVRYLHLRFRRFASGAKLRGPDEGILKMWALILQLISPSSSSSPSQHQYPARPPSQGAGVSKVAHGHATVNHHGVEPAKKGANVFGAAPAAARQEPAHQDANSTWSATEEVEDVYDCQEEINSHGEYQNNAENGNAASAEAGDDEFTLNTALLHHLTVADLAAAVKTLAEIVARGPKV